MKINFLSKIKEFYDFKKISNSNKYKKIIDLINNLNIDEKKNKKFKKSSTSALIIKKLTFKDDPLKIIFISHSLMLPLGFIPSIFYWEWPILELQPTRPFFLWEKGRRAYKIIIIIWRDKS